MQLLTGISISRYFPASGTAGLARSLVSGYRRVPAPPPRITARTFFTNNLSTADRSQVQCRTVWDRWQEGVGGSGRFFGSTPRRNVFGAWAEARDRVDW